MVVPGGGAVSYEGGTPVNCALLLSVHFWTQDATIRVIATSPANALALSNIFAAALTSEFL